MRKKTVYQLSNAEFSNRAHEASKTLIYPKLFGVPYSDLTFESTLVTDNPSDKNSILDGSLGIDRLVGVAVSGLRMPIQFSVQERFRRTQFLSYQDITITEWNHSSNLPSELYKIHADLFVYGYFNEGMYFEDVICVDVTALKLALINKTIEYDTGVNKKSQTFISFMFDRLKGITLYRQQSIDRSMEVGVSCVADPISKKDIVHSW